MLDNERVFVLEKNLDFEKACKYFLGDGIERDTKKAFELFEKCAKNGHLEAKVNLAGLYYSGEGVQKDYKKALELLEECAESGHADAQYNLGSMYFLGDGIEKDD